MDFLLGFELNYRHIIFFLVYCWVYGFPRLWPPRRKRSHQRPWATQTSETVDVLRDATAEERQRFFKAKRGNTKKADANLKEYLVWRQKYRKEIESPDQLSDSNDHDCWRAASRAALRLAGLDTSIKLPQIIRIHKNQALKEGQDGHRLFQILPGRMGGVKDISVFSTAVAIYFDIKLDRSSFEKVSVTIDVRGGRGWPNPHVRKLVPCIQKTCLLLLTMFPERLSHAIVYPIPSSFMWVWKLIRRCIDPLTREKIVIVPGSATIASPPPTEALSRHLCRETTEALESYRTACFA